MNHHEAFTSVLNTLKIKLGENITSKLREIDVRWHHWRDAELQHMDSKVTQEQEIRYANFIKNPSEINKRELIEYCDTQLVKKQYELLRGAYLDLRRATSMEAGLLLHPYAQIISKTFSDEYNRREKLAKPFGSNIERDPMMIEAKLASSVVVSWVQKVISHSSGQKYDFSPLKLAHLYLAIIEFQSQKGE
jgi:hypothetical protein